MGKGEEGKTTHHRRHNGPPINHLLLRPDQHRRLRHPMRIPLLLTDRHINDPPPRQLLHQQILHFNNGLAVVARRLPHLGQFGLGFGGDGEDVSARGADAGCEGLQLFEVGLAERTPVAAVDWEKGFEISGCVRWVGRVVEDVQTTKMKLEVARISS